MTIVNIASAELITEAHLAIWIALILMLPMLGVTGWAVASMVRLSAENRRLRARERDGEDDLDGTVDAPNASVPSMLGAMAGLHSTAAGDTMLMPPTADTASALAVTQQQANCVQLHSLLLLMLLEQLGERTAHTELADPAQQVSEAGPAAGFGL